jgi:hypothetical protein
MTVPLPRPSPGGRGELERAARDFHRKSISLLASRVDGAGSDEHRLVGGYFALASGIRLGQGTGREQARSYKTANPVGSGLRPRSSGLPGARNACWG